MSRKNRPNKQPAKLGPQPASVQPQPITYGNVFAAFVQEAQSIGNEIDSRRRFGKDVEDYLKVKGLVDDFVAWRQAKYAPPAVPAATPAK